MIITSLINMLMLKIISKEESTLTEWNGRMPKSLHLI